MDKLRKFLASYISLHSLLGSNSYVFRAAPLL
jgi:hypothetical protein